MSLWCGPTKTSFCHLKCDGDSSCQNLKVEENIWSIKCIQTSSCRGITARCTSGKSCLTSCDGTSACHNGKLYGKWSNVDCSGTSTCKYLTIQASENVKCTGTSSCQSLKIQSIVDSIKCWDTFSCHGLIASCTHGKSCQAKCHGTSTCHSAKFYGPWGLDCSGTSACKDTIRGSVQRPSSSQATIVIALLLTIIALFAFLLLFLWFFWFLEIQLIAEPFNHAFILRMLYQFWVNF